MKMKHRSEVKKNETWDLKDLFKTHDTLNAKVSELKEEVTSFNKTYFNKINNADTAIKALNDVEQLQQDLTRVFTYLSLYNAEDGSNQDSVLLSGTISLELSDSLPLLNFIDQELLLLSDHVLDEIKEKEPKYIKLVDDIKREKKHQLDPKVEDALSHLSATLNAPYEIYNVAKLVDMQFENVTHNDKEIEMNFGFFEDELAFELDYDLRHQAFAKFNASLKANENTFASIYSAQVLKEKSMAKLKNFDTTLDYLLFDQEISIDIYNNHIDTIMERLAPHMRKFAKHLQEIHHLETMTTNDLHLVVDQEFEPNISIQESKEQLVEGLNVLGSDYTDMIEKAFDERWIDFPQNLGKSTGAFCSSPYGVHPYILISWTQKMREVFVLAHELGHAGHFHLAHQNQSIHNSRPSLYLIEAPSTMNELLMANHLNTTSDDPRFKRWVLSTLISRTYYHNFVTHFLESYYQREVYRLIDENKALSSSVLNNIYLETLKKFWGDAVEISDGAELTWMRQPHYYMGLYPYTYSAGLSIATESSRKILSGDLSIDQWTEFLKAGGSKNPVDLAKIVDIDLNSDEALNNTIDTIGEMIDEIIELTAIINNQT
ncbi:MAG TPA: oligoendopeptidase F [Erysipelothrix sp.]|nr:oligoendopeptidase F [Erysipelothrix sp.]